MLMIDVGSSAVIVAAMSGVVAFAWVVMRLSPSETEFEDRGGAPRQRRTENAKGMVHYDA